MIVTDIKTQIVNLGFRNAVIVKVETDQGITGVSETVMKRKTRTAERSILELKRYLVGTNPTDIESHWEKMYRDSFWVGGPMHCSAISAIDCALWDILGKSCGLPVYKLLGGPTRQRILAYCHSPAGDSPEDFAKNVRLCIKRGYRAIKTTLPIFYGATKRDRKSRNDACIGYSGTNGSVDPRWKETEYLSPSLFHDIREYFVAAREVAGPDFGLALDCHGRLNLKNAVRLCRALEDLNLMFVEEPVPPENADILARVQRETSIPIAAGERWATIYGVREFIEKHAVDVLQCDVVNCGGISGLKKIAALAEAHYIPMAPHNPNGPVATAMNVHYAAAISNFLILETVGSKLDQDLSRKIVRNPISFEDGHLLLPCSPGFGIELNEDVLSEHPYVAQEGWR